LIYPGTKRNEGGVRVMDSDEMQKANRKKYSAEAPHHTIYEMVGEQYSYRIANHDREITQIRV
jgi:hypothetical protein